MAPALAPVYRSMAFRITRYSDDPAWKNIGTRTFASKPACTALDETLFSPPSERSNQVAGVGRNASDNRFYAVAMQADEVQEVEDPCCNPEPPEQPEPLDVWRQIGNATYASAPAATVAYGKLLVVGRRSDDRLYLHSNTLAAGDNPYDSQNWVPAVSVPSLPSCVRAVGDPTMTNGTEINSRVWIMTRAVRSNGSYAFYYIFWNNQSFSTWREFSESEHLHLFRPRVGGGLGARERLGDHTLLSRLRQRSGADRLEHDPSDLHVRWHDVRAGLGRASHPGRYFPLGACSRRRRQLRGSTLRGGEEEQRSLLRRGARAVPSPPGRA